MAQRLSLLSPHQKVMGRAGVEAGSRILFEGFRIYWLDGNRPAMTFDALMSMVVEAARGVESLKIKCFPKALEHEIAVREI